MILQSAVERQFEILGEAPNAYQRMDRASRPKLEEVSAAIAMKNLIAHEYCVVDVRTLAQIAHDDIPPLKTKLEILLKGLH
ncbi:hypothetical protein GCM10009720_01830 [Yaniella flava]|uniref:DUF86 domain-containing protein n=1 Tax=Yaniella flava TaxID=287930 RepID=A0ABP5FFW4_9MICC